MDNDDLPVGRVLTRREVLTLFGAAGAAFLAACVGLTGEEGATATVESSATGAPASTATQVAASTGAVNVPACVVRPELTEGPYFVDERLIRSDIRSDPSDGSVKDGLPLQLAFYVSQITADGCTPLAGVTVDVWHCDAAGVYSDVSDPGFNTEGQMFLRGAQLTDGDGIARFATIYPGWYQGRTVHIHFKIRTDPDSDQGYEFTSQLFFDDAVTDQVYAQEPYASKGERTLRNEGDGIYQGGGSQLLLDLSQADQGYSANFSVGLQI